MSMCNSDDYEERNNERDSTNGFHKWFSSVYRLLILCQSFTKIRYIKTIEKNDKTVAPADDNNGDKNDDFCSVSDDGGGVDDDVACWKESYALKKYIKDVMLLESQL